MTRRPMSPEAQQAIKWFTNKTIHLSGSSSYALAIRQALDDATRRAEQAEGAAEGAEYIIEKLKQHLAGAEETAKQWCRAADVLTAKLRAVEAERDQLLAALKSMTEDLEARWDMSNPSTNPGIRDNVEWANRVMAALQTPAGDQ